MSFHSDNNSYSAAITNNTYWSWQNLVSADSILSNIEQDINASHPGSTNDALRAIRTPVSDLDAKAVTMDTGHIQFAITPDVRAYIQGAITVAWPTNTPSFTATPTGSYTPTNTPTPLTGVNVNNGVTIVGPVPAHGVTDIGVETPIWNLSNRATTLDTGHVTISSMPNVSGSVSMLNGSSALTVSVSAATTLAAGSALIGVCSIYSTSANRSVSATGMAVSCLGAYPMKTLSMAVTSIGGSGAVTMALYAWSNPTYAGGVSVAAITITGASASGQTFISNPFPALQYGVSVLGIAASTTITAFVQGAQF